MTTRISETPPHPLCIICISRRKGHYLTDEAERWERVFSGLDELAKIEYPDEAQVGKVNSLLGSVHLIQPFNWRSWNIPFPTTDEIPSLSLVDCVKQITRLCRADRTNEGILWGALRSGILQALCRSAQQRAGGQPIGSLSDLSSNS